MNDLVASRVCWTIEVRSRTSPAADAGSVSTRRSTIWAWSTMLVRLWAGPSCIARAISRRRSSCASMTSRETPLGVEPPAPATTASPPAPPSKPRSESRYSATAVAIARERAPLALEDVDLGLHQRGALGQRDQRHGLVDAFDGIGVRAAARPACPPRPRADPRGGSTSALAWVMSRSISASSASSVTRSSPSRSVSAGAVEWRRGCGGLVRHQSSGIRIQPWRIAYTTAWVRSLTDSLRRMELMWFLTVCSLIDRA